MIGTIKTLINKALASQGLRLSRVLKEESSASVVFPAELTSAEVELIRYVKERGLSMASYERLWTTVMSCKHILERGIEGDFVECGVWRGGNALLAAGIFDLYKVTDRKVYLFDTFLGMTEPTHNDIEAITGNSAYGEYYKNVVPTHNEWCFASIEDVQNTFSSAGLLSDRVVFVQGDVLKTLEMNTLPTKIAVLRLDTDWYESTKKELEVLYPLITQGGILIIDDYGYWAGSKKATDEYFESKGNRPFLQYIDFTGRVGIKYE